MQKEGYETKGDSKRTYNTEKKELAIKALERGENLTKVATEYKVIHSFNNSLNIK